MIEPILLNPPNLLAALDRDLVYRQASYGWLERLGVSAGKDAALSELQHLRTMHELILDAAGERLGPRRVRCR